MRKGQHLIEFTVIGLVVFGICIISVFFFGDKLTALFKENNDSKIFDKNRIAVKSDTNALLSDVAIEINGKAVKSPIESVIRDKLLNGSYIQTSGSSGNISETMLILQKYIEQIEALLADMPASTQKDEFLAALDAYKKAITDYLDLDQKVVSGKEDPLVGLANKLDIAINLDLSGDIATNLNNKLQALIENSADSNIKNALELFSKDMLNIGSSLDYDVDSRIFQQLGLQSTMESFLSEQDNVVLNLQQQANSLQANYEMENKAVVDTNEEKRETLKDISDKVDKTDFYDEKSVKNLERFINRTNLSPQEKNTIKNKIDNIKHLAYECKSILAQKVLDAVNSNSISTEDCLKMINVFSNSNYTELAPNTINSGSLCTALSGTVDSNNCSLP